MYQAEAMIIILKLKTDGPQGTQLFTNFNVKIYKINVEYHCHFMDNDFHIDLNWQVSHNSFIE